MKVQIFSNGVVRANNMAGIVAIFCFLSSLSDQAENLGPDVLQW